MATVMLSGKLIDSIVWNIQRPLEQKASDFEEEARRRMTSHADEVWDFYTKADQPALRACNPQYLRLNNTVGLRLDHTKVSLFTTAALSDFRPTTPDMSAGSGKGLLYVSLFPEYDTIVSLLTEAKELRKESNDVAPKMKELCSKCGSLADLIKIFPSVQNYLDHETKTRLARKTERKKNKPKELPEDLASSLVKSRVFQST